MSIKGAAEAVLPPPAQGWLKQAIYHRNCHLSPPQYRAALKHWYWLFKGRPCHLEAPRTMTEKIHWLKLYDSTPLKGRLADKFLVREWVADTVGEEYLVPLLGVWDSPDEIDFASLPTSFVLKATHGSGWNILVPNKSALDEEWARGRLREWLGLRQAMKGGFELHYEYCEQRIVCERFLRDGTGGLRDYKFMVFDGVVQFAFTVDRRAGLAMRGTYLPDWTRAPFEYTCEAVRAPDVPRRAAWRPCSGSPAGSGRGSPARALTSTRCGDVSTSVRSPSPTPMGCLNLLPLATTVYSVIESSFPRRSRSRVSYCDGLTLRGWCL